MRCVHPQSACGGRQCQVSQHRETERLASIPRQECQHAHDRAIADRDRGAGADQLDPVNPRHARRDLAAFAARARCRVDVTGAR